MAHVHESFDTWLCDFADISMLHMQRMSYLRHMGDMFIQRNTHEVQRAADSIANVHALINQASLGGGGAYNFARMQWIQRTQSASDKLVDEITDAYTQSTRMHAARELSAACNLVLDHLNRRIESVRTSLAQRQQAGAEDMTAAYRTIYDAWSRCYQAQVRTCQRAFDADAELARERAEWSETAPMTLAKLLSRVAAGTRERNSTRHAALELIASIDADAALVSVFQPLRDNLFDERIHATRASLHTYFVSFAETVSIIACAGHFARILPSMDAIHQEGHRLLVKLASAEQRTQHAAAADLARSH